MKKMLPYIVLFVGSLLTVTLLVAIMFAVKPDLFSGGATQGEGAASDSTVTPGARKDSTFASKSDSTHAAIADSTASKPQVSNYARLADSLNTLVITLENEKKTIGDLRRKVDSLVALGGGGDTLHMKERKSTAKVLESMQAENAARILKDLTDEEVKAVLVYVKKRQAAKILSAIDPERAARILR